MKTLSDDELLDQLEDLNWCYRQLMSELHLRAEREQLFPSPLMAEANRRIRGYEVEPMTQPILRHTARRVTNAEIDLILSELEV